MAVDQIVSLFATLILIEMLLALGLGAEASAVLKAEQSGDLIVLAFFNLLFAGGAALPPLPLIHVSPMVLFARFQAAGIDLDPLSTRVRGDGTERQRLAKGRLTHSSHRKELLWQPMLGVSTNL